MQKNNYICEICGKPAKIVHHKEVLNEMNINDPNVSLNEDMLMAVCQECHNQIHYSKGVTQEGLAFDSKGNLVSLY